MGTKCWMTSRLKVWLRTWKNTRFTPSFLTCAHFFSHFAEENGNVQTELLHNQDFHVCGSIFALFWFHLPERKKIYSKDASE